MKKLPKVNTSKLLKAALPYILVGLMATKLGQAYRMASGGDVLDRILGAFLKIGEAFANPLPSLHPFDLLVGDACGALLWFIVYQKSKNARKYRRGAEYGKNVVVPIAGLVIAAVLTYELISMIIEKNNMHDIDTFMFFKWAFKSAAAAIIVNHTFDFIIAIFQVAQTMVQRSAGVIDTNASIDISSAIANITTELQATGLGDLFALMLETWVVSFAMKAMGLIITVILYGRMIEIYIYASVGPLPFATFMNREWGNIGTNYVRGLAALGLQGFLIMICVGIYAVLVNALSLGGDLQASIWSCAAYTVLLCFSLFKTGSVAKSILNAH